MARRTVKKKGVRNLIVVLGDQLNRDATAFAGFDVQKDTVWMAEVAEESTHVWSHKARIALFLSGMRHFRDALRAEGIDVCYRQLDDSGNRGTLAEELLESIRQMQPERLILVQPGDYRVRESLHQLAVRAGVQLEEREDEHFLCSTSTFRNWSHGRTMLRQEYFYRDMRRQTGILMDGKEPIGGRWNYDISNREAFGKKGPGLIPQPRSFRPDVLTKQVLHLVEKTFPDHPGQLEKFDWPVTPRDAQAALEDFIQNRLPDFGRYEDAMWTEQPVLYHSRLSAAMNLKLIDPRTVVAAAEKAYRQGLAPLEAVEGFCRQILGWREYVRGIYWKMMPGYLENNSLGARYSLPLVYWTGQTEMNCLRQTIHQTLELGYAHHIQRLMVTGLYALLFGVIPQQVHEWYLAIYVDAVEWVELPNVLGMSQFADGGFLGSKPYAASGKYIDRMSNYCKGCCYYPSQATGETACPITTLYWDFLLRHEHLLSKNQRMVMQIRNLKRLDQETRTRIRQQANQHRIDAGSKEVE